MRYWCPFCEGRHWLYTSVVLCRELYLAERERKHCLPC